MTEIEKKLIEWLKNKFRPESPKPGKRRDKLPMRKYPQETIFEIHLGYIKGYREIWRLREDVNGENDTRLSSSPQDKEDTFSDRVDFYIEAPEEDSSSITWEYESNWGVLGIHAGGGHFGKFTYNKATGEFSDEYLMPGRIV